MAGELGTGAGTGGGIVGDAVEVTVDCRREAEAVLLVRSSSAALPLGPAATRLIASSSLEPAQESCKASPFPSARLPLISGTTLPLLREPFGMPTMVETEVRRAAP